MKVTKHLRLVQSLRTQEAINTAPYALVAWCLINGDTTLPSTPVLPTVCSAEPKGTATFSQGIHGYICATVILKFTYFLIKGIMFCQK